MTTQAQYFEDNAIDGALTPEQAAQIMNLPEGDTGAQPDNSSAPDAATEQDNAPEPVLLARDGVHTIPYERLTEAREAEQYWKGQAAVAFEQMQALQADAQQRATTGVAPTAMDADTATAIAAIASGEATAAVFGDFSEEALAHGVQTLMDARDARLEAKVDQRIREALQPYQAAAAQSQTEQHYGAIYDRHPDANSIYDSAEFANWVNAQPSFARNAYTAILEQGETDQLIEIFDAYKQATGRPQAKTLDFSSAAQAAIAKAPRPVPVSLSDIPGGSVGAGSKYEALDAMSPAAMGEAMSGMTPDQINAYLDRNQVNTYLDRKL